VWGVIASNTWSLTLRRGGWKGPAFSVLSPRFPTTTSIANAHIPLLPTPVHGFCRGSSTGTLPSLKLYFQLPSSSCTSRRIALGDLTHSHRLSLYPIYLNLPNPIVREADALFLRLVRQLNQLLSGNWVERVHVLDPSVRSWADDVPKVSKWYIDTLRVCTQSTTWPTCNFVTSPMGACKDSSTKPIYPSGSTTGLQMCSTHPGSTPCHRHQEGNQPLHGWVPQQTERPRGLPALALKRPTTTTLHGQYDRVHCDIVDRAAKSSNNTAELTAIGEAIIWINLQPPFTTSSNEICSDSTYALDALDLTDPPIPSSSNQDLIHWCVEGLRAVRYQGHLLHFRKIKAHCTDKSIDTRGNNRADIFLSLLPSPTLVRAR